MSCILPDAARRGASAQQNGGRTAHHQMHLLPMDGTRHEVHHDGRDKQRVLLMSQEFLRLGIALVAIGVDRVSGLKIRSTSNPATSYFYIGLVLCAGCRQAHEGRGGQGRAVGG